MPLTPEQKDIAYVALLIAMSQPRSTAGQLSYLDILRATPNPATITNDDDAKALFTALDTDLYNEVHAKADALNPNALQAARANLARIANNMTGITGLLRDNHPWDPNTVCGAMVKVVANAGSI